MPLKQKNPYIDDEAEEEDEGNDTTTDEGDGLEQTNDGLEEFLEDDQTDLKSTCPLFLVDGEDVDELEAFAQELRQRYSDTEHPRNSVEIPEDWMSLLRGTLPVDGELWMVRTAFRSEANIANYLCSLPQAQVISAFAPPSLPGRVYIRTCNIQSVQRACRGLSVYGQFTLIPTDQQDATLALASGRSTRKAQIFVRIRRGRLYKDDLAFIAKIGDSGCSVYALVVPRIALEPDRKGKGVAHRFVRPIASFFKPEAVIAIHGVGSVSSDGKVYSFKGRMFLGGLEVIKISATHTEVELYPTLEELSSFYSCDFARPQIRAYVCTAVKRSWCSGQRLTVMNGQSKGLSCMLTDLQMDSASVVLIGPGDENNVEIQLPLADLEACFSVGDNVQVIAGDVSGRRGIVVKVDDTSLTVIEDKTRVEFLACPSLVEIYVPDLSGKSPALHRPSYPDHETQHGTYDNYCIGQRVRSTHGEFKGTDGYIRAVTNTGYTVNFPQIYTRCNTVMLRPEHIVFLDGSTSQDDGRLSKRPRLDLGSPSESGRQLTPIPQTPLSYEADRQMPLSPAWDPSSSLVDETRADDFSELFVLGSGQFLFDEDVCRKLNGRRIWVRFKISYEQGRFAGRNARTQPNRFAGPDGPAGPGEVAVTWTDNRAATRTANVHARHLEPTYPTAKGKQAILLSGTRRGEVVQIIRYKRKEGRATVSLVGGLGDPWEEAQSSMCMID